MIEHVQHYLQQVEQIRQNVSQKQALEQAKLRLALVQYPTIEFDPKTQAQRSPAAEVDLPVEQSQPGAGEPVEEPMPASPETMPWWNDGPPQFIEAGPRG